MTESNDATRQDRIARLEQISRIASRVAGGLLVVGMCGALSVLAGVVPSGNYQGAAILNLGLQVMGAMVVCGAVLAVGLVLFVTLTLARASHPAIVLLGGLLQVIMGLWLALFALRTPLTRRDIGGVLLVAACALSFLIAGGSLLALLWLRHMPLARTGQTMPELEGVDE